MRPQGLVQAIRLNAGGAVEVCAIDLPGLGKDASVLFDDLGVGDPSELAAGLLAADPRVPSFRA